MKTHTGHTVGPCHAAEQPSRTTLDYSKGPKVEYFLGQGLHPAALENIDLDSSLGT